MALGIIFSALALLIAGLALVVNVNRLRFDRMVSREVVALFEDVPSEPGVVDLGSELAGLPEPVGRYLRFSLGGTPRRITSVRLRHNGVFRLKKDQDWFAIEGEQYYTVERPAFVWHAEMRVAPLVWFEVRDMYRDTKGSILGKLCSSVAVVDSTGPELSRSSLLRWLAEAAWFPQAFLDRRHVRWEAVDDTRARATVSDGELCAAAVITFADDGRLERLDTNDRTMDVDGEPVPTPWSSVYSDWRKVNGVTIPFQGEVIWGLESGDFSYARFRLTRIEYDARSRF